MFFMSFLLVDPIAIGRADKHSMPHQTLMEMLVIDLQDKNCFRDKNGDFHDITLWKGVTLTQDGEVDSIDLHFYVHFSCFDDSDNEDNDDEDPDAVGVVRPGGSIDLQWIPSSVTDFRTSDLNLAGSIDTLTLPRELNDLNLENNCFSGTFNAAGLPQSVHMLNVSHNQFCGSLDLTSLPQKLRVFDVSHNDFSGSINLSSLPTKLNALLLQDNRLSGSIDLRFLPRKLLNCRLEQNKFEQEVVVFASDRSNVFTASLDNGKFQSFVDADGGKVPMDVFAYGKVVSLRIC